MKTVRKDVLYAGTVHPPGMGEPIRFSREDLAHYARRLRDMVADGLQIPVSWEHQSKAKPRTREEWEAEKAELTKLCLGHARAATVDEGGVLVAEFDVPDDGDRARLPSVGFVSPEIKWDWTDGRGKTWPGPSITHVAVTPRPVQHDQQRFTRDSVGLSLRLSLDDYVWLGDSPMADEKDDKDDRDDKPAAAEKEPDNDEPEKGEAEPEMDMPDMTDMPDMANEQPADVMSPGAQRMVETLAALQQLGLVLPDDTTPKNLLERLHTAALTKLAHKDHPLKDEQDEQGPEQPEQPEQPGNGADDAQPEPMPPPTAGVTLSMSERRELNALKARLARTERDDLRRRIDRLKTTGRIDRTLHDALARELGTVRLSLTEAGELAENGLVIKVKAYEALPAGRNGFGLSQDEALPAEAPDGLEGSADGNQSPDPEVMAKLTGGRWKPAQANGASSQ